MPIETIMDNDETLTESGFFWREHGGVKVLVCKALENAGFANGFSTRLGGVSEFPSGDLNLAGFDEDDESNIRENRRRFLKVFDDDYRLSTVWQVHGKGVKTIDSQAAAENTAEEFDAIISSMPGLLIGVKTADCVPVLVGDPAANAFAAIHAGWRGTAAAIVAAAIESMHREFGSRPADLVCAIGPAATIKNYEIGQEVIDRFDAKYLNRTRPGHAMIDLNRANRDQCIALGVNETNIFTAPFCTMERTDLFFSYRREKFTLGKTGRLLSVIGRRS